MNTSKLDIADYLEDDELFRNLNAVLEEGDSQEIVTALGHIAMGNGMSKIAQQTGLSKPNLNEAVFENAKIQFDTI